MSNYARNLYSVIWSIGAILIIYYSSTLLEFAQDWSSKTFNIRGYHLWIPIIVSLFSGIYLALMKGIPKHVRLDSSKFVVFAISFATLVYFVLSFYLALPLGHTFIRIMSFNGQFFIGLISGYSMMLSLFKVKDVN
ncbi:hypothetical protein [Paenibacillus sp. CF384]|uniref:hypothetical protein n=1 Tax=Paenibacillus sp. CF384 TaxID=1884382 RepID=UPI000897BD7C|nr:hypothetical protein [Paenibacillus sp. CF384]SDX04916.1 hypothetical protein SAMN05518855_100855 [Paenibacillus sp. CF384]